MEEIIIIINNKREGNSNYYKFTHRIVNANEFRTGGRIIKPVLLRTCKSNEKLSNYFF